MIISVTTENGSIYEIDTTRQTWTRAYSEPWSDQVRGGTFTYWGYYLKIGEPLRIYGEPLTVGADVREVTTSPVVSVNERDDQ